MISLSIAAETMTIPAPFSRSTGGDSLCLGIAGGSITFIDITGIQHRLGGDQLQAGNAAWSASSSPGRMTAPDAINKTLVEFLKQLKLGFGVLVLTTRFLDQIGHALFNGFKV